MSALNSLQQGCGGRAGGDSAEGQELRIAGLFAILATSAIGVSLPLLSRGRYPSLLFIARCFGAGIVLATGFAHVRALLVVCSSLTSTAWANQAAEHCCAGHSISSVRADLWCCHHCYRCCSTRCRTCRTFAWAGTEATHSPWSLPHTAPWAPLLLVRTAAQLLKRAGVSPQQHSIHGKQPCVQTVVLCDAASAGAALNSSLSVHLQRC